MKLRVRGDSLRLRLTRPEVDALASGHAVEERVRFGPGVSLRYAVVVAEVAAVEARFDGSAVSVRLPRAEALAWATGETVGLYATQSAGDGAELRLAVEKDFACMVVRAGEDDRDAFAHPDAGCAPVTLARRPPAPR